MSLIVASAGGWCWKWQVVGGRRRSPSYCERREKVESHDRYWTSGRRDDRVSSNESACFELVL